MDLDVDGWIWKLDSLRGAVRGDVEIIQRHLCTMRDAIEIDSDYKDEICLERIETITEILNKLVKKTEKRS